MLVFFFFHCVQPSPSPSIWGFKPICMSLTLCNLNEFLFNNIISASRLAMANVAYDFNDTQSSLRLQRSFCCNPNCGSSSLADEFPTFISQRLLNDYAGAISMDYKLCGHAS